MRKIIYADNAATTKLDIEAFEAMKPFLLDGYGNISQPYSFSRTAKKAVQEARETIAACINALPEEIYFTSGGSESDNWALKGTMIVPGDQRVLLTSRIEHHAILHSAATIEKMGYPVVYLPVDENGIVLPETLQQYIADNAKMVSIMFSNNEVGTIEPIKELAAIAHAHGATFHTDAVQSVGHVTIDLKELDVDMLSASAHKFNGPKGVGFLYIKKGCMVHSFIDGGAQEFGMRAGTENVASIVGMATALKLNVDRLADHSSHLEMLEKALLSALDGANLDYRRNGSKNHVPGNISLSFRNIEGEMLFHRMDLMGICISTGSACDSKNTQISHVLQAMHVPEEYAAGTIRISLGRDNTVEDIDRIAGALIKILAA